MVPCRGNVIYGDHQHTNGLLPMLQREENKDLQTYFNFGASLLCLVIS